MSAVRASHGDGVVAINGDSDAAPGRQQGHHDGGKHSTRGASHLNPEHAESWLAEGGCARPPERRSAKPNGPMLPSATAMASSPAQSTFSTGIPIPYLQLGDL